MVRKAAQVVAVALGALGIGAAAAAAHPLLVTAAPAPGSLLPTGPTTLALAFSEAAVPQGSAVTVRGPAGRSVALGRLRGGGRSGAQLSAALPSRVAPGVYRVHWVALGEDGHSVSGEFAFAVAERNGTAPPGVAGLAGIGQGRGGSGAGEAGLAALARWVGILAAALLWGGWLLGAVLRGAGRPALRRGPPAGGQTLVLAAALAGAAGTALGVAGAGEAGGLRLGLLLDSGTGIAALARVGVVLAAAALYLAVPRRGGIVLGLSGALLLAGYGISGHVLAEPGPWPAVVMAVHLVAAGAWAGGLLTLLMAVRAGDVELAPAVRAYGRVAVGALGLVAFTGVITAVREVGHLYFLWNTAYGRLVLVKAGLLVAVVGLGGWAALRARRGALAAEGALALVLVAVATVLSGATQGRGQPLPAQRGDLLPGPALASAVLPRGIAPMTLAPARPGANTVVVSPPAGARAVQVRMVCGCDVRPVIADLHPVAGTPNFRATVPVPTAGTWNAYLTVDGTPAPAPAALVVGVAGAPGAAVRDILAPADLSGPGAARCRAYLAGVELAIGRLNGAGGVDGGHKAATLALDDGGSASVAAATVGGALHGPRPVAVLPCGAGAEAGAAVAARDGIPVLAGDPATGLLTGERVFRVAGDPYADGTAIAQSIAATVLPAAAPGARTVTAIAVDDDQGRRRLSGLRAGLAALGHRVRVATVAPAALLRATPGGLTALLNRATTAALVLDGTDAQAPALAAALARLPARGRAFAPAPVIVSERLLSESLIERAGDAGRLGVVQGTSTVAVDSRDGLTLTQALPALFAGQRASLEALRGYVAGLALVDGLGGGSAPASVAARLRRPAPFTDAIPAPWRADAPALGTQQLGVLEPNFMSANLIPTTQGGESFTGDYFADGAWERPTSQFFGPSLRRPVVPLALPGP